MNATKNKILSARSNINKCREQLSKLEKVRYKKNYFQQHKNLFVENDLRYDQQAFENDLKTYELRKQKSLERLKRDQDKRDQHTFQPQINHRTHELTQHMLPFAEKVEKHLRQAKSINDLRKQQKKEKTRQEVKSRTKDPHVRNRMKTMVTFEEKMRQEERVERSRKFFLENLQWKKEVEEKTFAQQALQTFAKEGLTDFKQSNRIKGLDRLQATTQSKSNLRAPFGKTDNRSLTPTMKSTVRFTNIPN